MFLDQIKVKRKHKLYGASAWILWTLILNIMVWNNRRDKQRMELRQYWFKMFYKILLYNYHDGWLQNHGYLE